MPPNARQTESTMASCRRNSAKSCSDGVAIADGGSRRLGARSEAPQRLVVFVLRLADDFLGQLGRVVRVPVAVDEIVADVLLVEALRRAAGAVAFLGPEARGVRCQDFVDQDQLAVADAEFEFRVGDDDAFLLRHLARAAIDRETRVAELL